MAQNSAFLSYGASTAASISGAGITTVTIGTAATGLPATAVRLWNSGTAIAFIMIGTGSATTLTVTGAAANGMPMPVSIAPFVLRTGGVSTVQLGCTGTFTNTIYVTGGEGIG